MSNSNQENKKREEMSFLEHLEHLRWHLVRSLAAVFVIAIVAFIYKDIIFDVLILGPKQPDFFTSRILCRVGDFLRISALCINQKPFEIINYTMTGQFMTHIIISLIAGIVLAFPYIFFEFWRFISPALYEQERAYTRGAVFFCSVLFVLGILFGYYVISPLSINFLGSYQVSSSVENKIQLMSYISTITTITLACGVLFELPVLVLFLSKLGLVTPSFLKKYRRHALVVILVLSAIITPPDIFSQILVCFPLLVLYEISIFISRSVVRKQEEALETN